MLSDANFLLLDEPTNHLDITSKEILESALNRYTGTVLYVSHDRYFINRTATRILDLTDGSFINYIGNYDYYLEKKEDVEAAFAARQMAQTAANHPTGTNSPQAASTASGISSNRTSQTAMTASSAGSPADGKIDWKAQKEEQARLRKKENDLKKCEEKIAELEARISEIDTEMSDPAIGTQVAKLQELSKEQTTCQEQLEKLYEQWEELAE
jgi:ATP-binding cassette subfamily F protein 3